jgi:hypothetical protein
MTGIFVTPKGKTADSVISYDAIKASAEYVETGLGVIVRNLCELKGYLETLDDDAEHVYKMHASSLQFPVLITLSYDGTVKGMFPFEKIKETYHKMHRYTLS